MPSAALTAAVTTIGLVCACADNGLADQPGRSPEPMKESAVRSLVRRAQTTTAGDATDLVLALDKEIRVRWGDFESFPISIVRREDLAVTLTTPFMGFRRALVEHLRLRQPLGEVPWVGYVVIAVSPERLEAPDIERLVIERDGRIVAPVQNRLRPMSFTNGRGETATIHAGELYFPTWTVASGAVVTVRATTRDGTELTREITDSELRRLR
jgi:hypothetical protein